MTDLLFHTADIPFQEKSPSYCNNTLTAFNKKETENVYYSFVISNGFNIILIKAGVILQIDIQRPLQSENDADWKDLAQSIF